MGHRTVSFLDTRAHVQFPFQSLKVFERNTSMNVVERFYLLPLSSLSHRSEDHLSREASAL